MSITKPTMATNNIAVLDPEPNDVGGLTDVQLQADFDKFGVDCKDYLTNTLTAEVDTLDAANVKKTGDQTVAGIKTFSSSPIVPTPTTDMQTSTKKYVDDTATGLQAQITSNDGDILALQTADGQDVKLTGNQTVAGIKTFLSSPIVPTPTGATQASNKGYIDSVIGGVVLGQIPDGTITPIKLSFDPATQVELDNLAGAGRTIETVKGNSDNLITHLAESVIYLKDFGVTGVGDESDKIQAALDFINTKVGGTRALDIGLQTYYAKNLVGYSNLTIFSSGGGTLKTHSSAVIDDDLIKFTNCTNIVIDNVIFDGNIANTPGDATTGITLLNFKDNCTNILVKNSFLQNNDYVGVRITNGCDKLKFVNNNFINTDCGIITMGVPSNNIIISKNYFDGHAASEPIAIYGTSAGYHSDIVITDNICKNHTSGNGILVKATKNAIITGNLIDNCASGISIIKSTYDSVDYRCSNIQCSNNVITGSTVGQGITVNNTDGGKISDNLIQLIYQIGIWCTDCKYIDISNNNLIDTNGANNSSFDCMVLNGMTSCTISHNSAHDTRGTPLHVSTIRLDGVDATHKSTYNFCCFNRAYPENKMALRFYPNTDNNLAFGTRGNTSDNGTNNKMMAVFNDTMSAMIMETISTASFTLYSGFEFLQIHSAALLSVTSITKDYVGKRITLYFTNLNITLVNGGNLKLGSNFTPATAYKSNISLICDGTNWIETGRLP